MKSTTAKPPAEPLDPLTDPSTTPTSRLAPVATVVAHRLVLPIQTRGNIGKSTEAIARCEGMSQRHVQWRG